MNSWCTVTKSDSYPDVKTFVLFSCDVSVSYCIRFPPSPLALVRNFFALVRQFPLRQLHRLRIFMVINRLCSISHTNYFPSERCSLSTMHTIVFSSLLPLCRRSLCFSGMFKVYWLLEKDSKSVASQPKEKMKPQYHNVEHGELSGVAKTTRLPLRVLWPSVSPYHARPFLQGPVDGTPAPFWH